MITQNHLTPDTMTDQILEHIGNLILNSDAAGEVKELCLSFHVISASAAGPPEGDSPVVITSAAATPKRRGRPAKTPDPESAVEAVKLQPVAAKTEEVVEIDLVAEDAPVAARTKDDLRNLINSQLKLIDGKDRKAEVILAWAEIFKANGAKDTSSLAEDKVESVIQGLEAYIAKNLS